VLGLVLGGVFGQPQRESAGLLEVSAEFADIEDPTRREIAHEFQASTTAGPLDPEQLDMFVDESLKVPARVWREAFTAFAEVDHSAEVRSLDLPVPCWSTAIRTL
jgi:non-heme chloroperoxidase